MLLSRFCAVWSSGSQVENSLPHPIYNECDTINFESNSAISTHLSLDYDGLRLGHEGSSFDDGWEKTMFCVEKEPNITLSLNHISDVLADRIDDGILSDCVNLTGNCVKSHPNLDINQGIS